MDRTDFLECLKAFTEEATKDLQLPAMPEKHEIPFTRSVAVYKMGLPDFTTPEKKVPYILHKLISATDGQNSGQKTHSSVTVRSIFAVYSQNAEEGGLMLVEMMERVRIAMLKSRVIGKRYELDADAGISSSYYEDDIAPFYAGEMQTTWKLPSVERETRIWQNENK